jgi:predicted nucleic acid-binding protein
MSSWPGSGATASSSAPSTAADPVSSPAGRVLVVLDTDVVSQYRAGRLPASYSRHMVGNRIGVAFATAGELLKGAGTARWSDARRGGLELWLDQVEVLDADLQVARTWGTITAEA